MKADIALFSAGGDTSLEWAPKFAATAGTTVIDNSSAEWILQKLLFRKSMQAELTAADKIINQTARPFKWCWFLLLCIKILTSNVVVSTCNPSLEQELRRYNN
jgi:hypothetical protein